MGYIGEFRYFFSDEMLEKGVFIEWSHAEFLEHNIVQEVSVKIVNAGDAHIFNLVLGNIIEEIRIYSIIKSVLELFNEYKSTEEFIWAMGHVAMQGDSASNQPTSFQRKRFQSDLEEELQSIKQYR